MSEKMSNAPVYYALAQVQFNPIAAMAKYVPEIQDLLRREGYPLFGEQKSTQLRLVEADGRALVDPSIEQTTSWVIAKKDKTAGFILSPSAIAYHTTHYETSEKFIPELLTGIRAVHEIIKLDHISRMGLRYLDAVLPLENETVEQYLNGGLHGVHFGQKEKYTLSEAVFETECEPLLSMGTLVVRIYRMTSPLGYPPDLMPGDLVPLAKFAGKETIRHAVIDTDHFVSGQVPLDLGKIGEQLLSLHAGIKQAFIATTTEHAKNTWA